MSRPNEDSLQSLEQINHYIPNSTPGTSTANSMPKKRHECGCSKNHHPNLITDESQPQLTGQGVSNQAQKIAKPKDTMTSLPNVSSMDATQDEIVLSTENSHSGIEDPKVKMNRVYSPQQSQARYNYVPPSTTVTIPKDKLKLSNHQFPSVRSFNIIIQRSPTEYNSLGESTKVFKKPLLENPIEMAEEDEEEKIRDLMTGRVAPYDLAGDVVEVIPPQQESGGIAKFTELPSSHIRLSQEQITEVDEGGDLSQQAS